MSDDLADLVVFVAVAFGVSLIGLVGTAIAIRRRTRLDLPAGYRLPQGRLHEQLIDALRAGSKAGRHVRVGSLKKALGISYQDINYVIGHLETDGSIAVRRQSGIWDATFAPYAVTLNYKAREGLGEGGALSVRDIIVQAGRDAQVAVINGNVSIDARVFLNAVRERIDDSATPEHEKSELRKLLDAAQRLGENVLANIIAAWLAKQVPSGD